MRENFVSYPLKPGEYTSSACIFCSTIPGHEMILEITVSFRRNFLLLKSIGAHDAQKIRTGIPLRPEMDKTKHTS